MSDSGANPSVPDDEDPDRTEPGQPAGGIPGLDEVMRMLGMPAGAAGGGAVDLEAVMRELLGPDAQLPPELGRMISALQADPSTDPMAAMLQRQVHAFFADQDPQQRLDAATDLARKVVAARGERLPGAVDRREVESAVSVARLWIDPVTALDSPAGPALAWSAAEWVQASMPRWFAVVEPVAEGFAAASGAAMRKQLGQLGDGGMPDVPGLAGLGGADGIPGLSGALEGGAEGGLGGMLGQMEPALQRMSEAMFTAQLGQAVGALSADVLSGTEVGLPLTDEGVVALLPERVAEFAAGLELDLGQVRLYLAVREAARVRLFAEVPWLAAQLEATVRDYARHIVIDTEAIEATLREVDPSDLTAVQEAFSRAEVFGRRPTPEQQAALDRLETTLALVEGWVDLVTDQAVAAHLPGAGALGEAVRRRRAGGPAEKTFAALVGLELRPRRLRDARNLWAALEHRGGLTLRDGSWAHPDLAPTGADLDDPLGYVERRVHPPAPDAMDADLDRLLSGFDDGAGPAGPQGPGQPG